MAFDAFLKISTIPGESTDTKHKDWIEVLTYDHGMSQPTTGSTSSSGARTAERVDHHDFMVVKALDKATPKIALACSNGEHIPEVILELCRATGDKAPFMQYKMTDVLISSNQLGGQSGGETLPLEHVTFNYAKIEWTHTETDHKSGKSKGAVKTHWDTSTNKGG